MSRLTLWCPFGPTFDLYSLFNNLDIPRSCVRPNFKLIEPPLTVGLNLEKSIVKMPLNFKAIKSKVKIM